MPETSVGLGALTALVIFIVASVWLGALAQRAVQRSSFLQGYFLGNRGLGAWAFALTVTVQSGGTFMGFPSLVYSFGWIVALWIAAYMVVPLSGFGVLAKRFSQLSRRAGAVTVPDLFRARFASPTTGLVSSLLIIFFMSFMMVAQFKAGALVMKIAWPKDGSLSLSEDKAAFQLSGAAFEALRDRSVPHEVLAKLEPLRGQGFDNGAQLTEQLKKLLTPTEAQEYGKVIVAQAEKTDWLFLFGLLIFTVTVVGYTLIGGFLAAVWTDLFQSVMMFIGVLILLALVFSKVGSLEYATLKAVENAGAGFASGPGVAKDGRQFLSPGLAFSFFFVWVFAGVGSPASLVRMMACKDTPTIRRSVFLLAAYNTMIYLPLIMICIAARAIMPNLASSDEVIPRMALWGTQDLWLGSFAAGLILAAPFGAVMSTVSAYLVVIASGLVRDVYQRFINREATEHQIKRLTYCVMILVGAVAVLANLRPVTYLQAIVVFCGASGAATFVVPAVMAAFWRRATATGAMAAMLTGAGMSLLLLILGTLLPDQMIGEGPTRFRSYCPLGIGPIVWGLLASGIAGVVGSLLTPPPDEKLVSRFFDIEPARVGVQALACPETATQPEG
jgi:Na+/pantothenate symporter